jgi:hypothetical protein
VLCQLAAPGLEVRASTCFEQSIPGAANWHNTKCRLCSTSWWWESNARNMYRPLILNKLIEKCIALVSLYWYTTSIMHVQQHYFHSLKAQELRCVTPDVT